MSMNQTNNISKVLNQQLAKFIGSGVAIVVASRNQALEPHLCRAWAGKLSADRQLLSLYLPTLQGRSTLADLAQNRQFCAVFSRPTDYFSIQLKGQCIEIGDDISQQQCQGLDEVQLYWQQFSQALQAVGLTQQQSQSLWAQGITPITVAIEQCFGQTPGPDAGRELTE